MRRSVVLPSTLRRADTWAMHEESTMFGFMKVPGIQGEAKMAGFKNWIPIHSVHYVPTQVGLNDGVAYRLPQPDKIFVLREADSSSPHLHAYFLKNRIFNHVEVQMFKPGKKNPVSFLKCMLKDALIDHYTLQSRLRGRSYSEELHFRFSELAITFGTVHPVQQFIRARAG